jgi:uncharacterized protein DUF4114
MSNPRYQKNPIGDNISKLRSDQIAICRAGLPNSSARLISGMRSCIHLILIIATISLSGVAASGADLTLTRGGRVTVELVFSDAQFSNTLAVFSGTPGVGITNNVETLCSYDPSVPVVGIFLFSEKKARRGCRVELDGDATTPGVQPIPAGTKLVFNMCVQTDPDNKCGQRWFSDPSRNSDGFDHLRTTAIHPAEFPSQIFQLAWEDVPGGGDLDFNDLIAVLRVDMDADADGLWDDWEQFGVDTNGDGVADFDLPNILPVDLNNDGDTTDPGEKTSPLRKDVFVEIDYMDCSKPGSDCEMGDTHNHMPSSDAIRAVVVAFRDAPVMNPDGSKGITLHVEVSNAFAHHKGLVIPGECFDIEPGIFSFDDVKNDPANFGPDNARRFAFHYCLFTHNQRPGFSDSGCGEIPGNDFQVSLGGWTGGGGSPQQQAGTLMHELGHNLGLHHGGSIFDPVNLKPNYISVMNYAFQLRGIPPTDPDGSGPLAARVDYSRVHLLDLNESLLDELAGIGDGADNVRTDQTRFKCSGTMTETMPSVIGPIDWNCDGDSTDAGIGVDLNQDGVLEMLSGFNDWANLRFSFQGAGSFADGQHMPVVSIKEIDFPTHARLAYGVGLQDDSNGNIFLVNPSTGEYEFTKCGSNLFSLTGRGAISRKGCMLTLQDNRLDRRALLNFDTCQNRGSASVQSLTLGSTFTITERNVSNNTYICP